MALLNFKMGLQANLTQNSPVVAPGTIYVTTDERAMYVDVPAVEGGQAAHRIRLGDFRIYSTFEDLKKDKTDWSQSCLYYVADKNALARYNGTEWVLINDTASLNTAIQGVASRVVTLEGQLKGIDATEGAVKAYIDAADEAIGTRIGAVEDRAKALEDAVGKDAEGENAATGLFKEIDDVADKVAILEGFISGGEQGSLDATIDARIDTKIQALDSEKSSAAVEAGKGLQATVKQVDGVITEVSLTGDFDKKYDALGAANTVSQNLTQAINDLDTAYKAADVLINAKLEGIDTTVVAAIDAAKTAAVTSANSHADGLVSDLKGGSDKTIKQLADEIAGNDGDIAGLQAAVGESGLGGRVSALEGKVDVEKVSTAIATAKSGAEATAKGYADTAEANAKAEVTALANGQVKTNKEAIEALQSAIGDDGLGKKVSALETAINTTIPATYETKNDAATKLQEAKNYSDANLVTAKAYTDTLANGQVKTNKEAIEALQGVINGENGLSKDVQDLQDKVDVEGTVSAAIEAAKTTAAGDATTKANKALEDAKDYTDELANGQVKTNKEAIEGLQQLIGTVDSPADGTVFKAIQENAEDIAGILNDTAPEGSLVLDSFADVRTFVASSIAANDAMVFKGVVNSTSGLPASGMENGDTYKVAETGAYTVKADGTTEDAKVGDLFIYDGTAGEWRLIPSGGEDYKDPVLSAVDNKIVLTSTVTNQQVGTVEIVGANDSLTISTADNKITLALEWGTF